MSLTTSHPLWLQHVSPAVYPGDRCLWGECGRSLSGRSSQNSAKVMFKSLRLRVGSGAFTTTAAAASMLCEPGSLHAAVPPGLGECPMSWAGPVSVPPTDPHSVIPVARGCDCQTSAHVPGVTSPCDCEAGPLRSACSVGCCYVLLAYKRVHWHGLPRDPVALTREKGVSVCIPSAWRWLLVFRSVGSVPSLLTCAVLGRYPRPTPG